MPVDPNACGLSPDWSLRYHACPCPVSQPETCVSMETVSDPHTVTVSMDSSEISMIIDSIKKECLASGAGSAAGPSKDHSMDGKEDLDLAEKMDIAVSYTGEELDFETVGDIIAIIEDKVTAGAAWGASCFCLQISLTQSCSLLPTSRLSYFLFIRSSAAYFFLLS